MTILTLGAGGSVDEVISVTFVASAVAVASVAASRTFGTDVGTSISEFTSRTSSASVVAESEVSGAGETDT